MPDNRDEKFPKISWFPKILFGPMLFPIAKANHLEFGLAGYAVFMILSACLSCLQRLFTAYQRAV